MVKRARKTKMVSALEIKIRLYKDIDPIVTCFDRCRKVKTSSIRDTCSSQNGYQQTSGYLEKGKSYELLNL